MLDSTRRTVLAAAPNRETFKDDHGHEAITIVGNTIHTVNDGVPRRDMWIGAEVKNVRIEGNTLSGHGIFYGGHHKVYPQVLLPIAQPIVLNNMTTPDEPKF